jgi:ABC-type branched-subunit amino acid transport system permease subunit
VTQAQLIADATQDVVLAAFIASLAFIAVYTVMAPWWRSPIGRALIMLDASLALTLAPSSLHQVTGITITASLGFAWYYLVSLTMVAASTIWRTWIIYRAQRPRRPGG